jgi:hypothetical protein
LRKIFYDLQWPPTNIALVCHRLHDIAEPILYEQFRGKTHSTLEGYMKAIIRRPALAEHLKFFHSITADMLISTNNQKIKLPWQTDENYERLRRYLQDDIYGKEKCDRWYTFLDNRFNFEVVLGFLLNLVSARVERLVLQTEGYHPYVQIVAEEAVRSQEAAVGAKLFTKLRTVHLNYLARLTDTIPMDFVLPYLKLKSVVCLSVHGLTDEVPLSQWRTDPLSISDELIPPVEWRSDPFQIFSIVDLTLTRVRMSPRSVQNFLERFQALKYFKYEDTATYVLDPIVISAIIAGLEHSKHCLESLQLRGTGEILIQEQVFNEYDPVVQMNRFEKLR